LERLATALDKPEQTLPSRGMPSPSGCIRTRHAQEWGNGEHRYNRGSCSVSGETKSKGGTPEPN
jgi:hypothetical protein